MKIEIIWDSRTLDNKVQKGRSGFFQINRSVMQEAGTLYRVRARELSGKRTGEFKKGWGYRTKVSKGGESVELVLQNSDPNARYKLFKTNPHWIYPKNKKALRIVGLGIFSRVFHPGTKGNDVFEKLRSDSGLHRDVEKRFEGSLQKLANKL